MSAPAALEVRGLGKSFGAVRAVDGADFDALPGRVTVLLGRNGAGKTTALKLLLGFLRPDAGSVRLRARRPAYVPEEPAFFPWLAGGRLLLATLRAFGPPGRRDGRGIGDWMARLGFDPSLLARPVRTYSHGNRKKFAFLQALVLEPDALVVDEPLAALDPAGIKAVRDIVVEAARGGAAVLLSSHIIAEMEKIADRVVVMHGGRVVARDTLDRIRGFAPRQGPGGLEGAFLKLTE